MAGLATLEELPPGYELEQAERGLLAVKSELSAALRQSGFDLEGREELRAVDLSGRGALGELELDGQRALVRRFTHGGLLRWFTGARFADPTRPFRELILSERLRAVAVRTPPVVAARARRAGLGWRLDLVTRAIENAADLGDWMQARRSTKLDADFRLDPAAWRALIEGLGEFIGGLHRVGFLHADLHPKNVLGASCADGWRFWVVDLDQSRFVTQATDDERRDNLRRLARWLDRHGLGARISRADLMRFGRGYDRGLERKPHSFHADLRAMALRSQRRSMWHRLGWWLERAGR